MNADTKERAIAHPIVSILGLILFVLTSASASAVDYYNTVITGVGMAAGEDVVRFTIDKDPYLILTTGDYSGEQLKRLTAMILSAYSTQTPDHLVRSAEATSASTYHYSNVIFISLGARTWD
jgi:hypothetical protein